MKKLTTIIASLFALISSNLVAQTPSTSAPLSIKGDMKITFNTKSNPVGTKGIQDIYSIDLNVANSVVFHGEITDRPQIIEGMISKSITQPRNNKYNIDCNVLNPANISQSKNIGRMYGVVPISSEGIYDYDKSNLVVDILPIGNSAGFTSKFTGKAAGKPLVRPSNWTDTVRDAVNITRMVNGKPSTVTLKRYDKLEFRNVVLAQGPIQIYQSVSINGTMLYDYDKNCWFFNNFTSQYADGQTVKIDRIAGTMRWVEDSNRKSNGIGHYDTDIRVNEPIQDGSSVFSAPTDESSFFATNSSIPGLVGTLKYKDTINSEGNTVASLVNIDLNANNINKQQIMVLAKIIIFSAIIPMNSD